MLSMFALAAALTATPSIDAHVKPVCQDPGVTTVARDKVARAQKLNELPNANLYLGVMRKQGGCSKPAIVRYDIGSNPKKQR